ncbi:hypothetical protein [Nocardiopsis ganjiahuensis]|uniref:hypothetical protein n=1 Tax=Nocardiopsis ganjiahuensis TaxID=239984 RepID=UPI000347A014|nr:hypothetical protein [Nocardiopsis ganjiahuensis]
MTSPAPGHPSTPVDEQGSDEQDTEAGAAPASTDGPPPPPAAPPGTGRPGWVTALWMGHGLLRLWLFHYLMIYGWLKVLMSQMGLLDYSSALLAFGEKSPMGLLWSFVAYAPVFQVLSGLVEILAGALLIWRRTAWLGGLLGAMAMGAVFLLNLLYDVPVKQLALVMAVGCVLVLLPEVPRLLRFLTGRPTEGATTPRPVPWPRVHAVTRWIFGSLGVLVLLGPIALAPTLVPQASDSPLPGVYRVVGDTAEPAAQLSEDERWQEVAFGQYASMSGAYMLTIRHANGDLWEGRYEHIGEGEIEVSLYPVMEGDRGLVRDTGEPFTLGWEIQDDGRVHVEGAGQDLVLESDPELRYLYDREFSWAPNTPVNR